MEESDEIKDNNEKNSVRQLLQANSPDDRPLVGAAPAPVQLARNTADEASAADHLNEPECSSAPDGATELATEPESNGKPRSQSEPKQVLSLPPQDPDLGRSKSQPPARAVPRARSAPVQHTIKSVAIDVPAGRKREYSAPPSKTYQNDWTFAKLGAINNPYASHRPVAGGKRMAPQIKELYIVLQHNLDVLLGEIDLMQKPWLNRMRSLSVCVQACLVQFPPGKIPRSLGDRVIAITSKFTRLVECVEKYRNENNTYFSSKLERSKSETNSMLEEIVADWSTVQRQLDRIAAVHALISNAEAANFWIGMFPPREMKYRVIEWVKYFNMVKRFFGELSPDIKEFLPHYYGSPLKIETFAKLVVGHATLRKAFEFVMQEVNMLMGCQRAAAERHRVEEIHQRQREAAKEDHRKQTVALQDEIFDKERIIGEKDAQIKEVTLRFTEQKQLVQTYQLMYSEDQDNTPDLPPEHRVHKPRRSDPQIVRVEEWSTPGNIEEEDDIAGQSSEPQLLKPLSDADLRPRSKSGRKCEERLKEEKSYKQALAQKVAETESELFHAREEIELLKARLQTTGTDGFEAKYRALQRDYNILSDEAEHLQRRLQDRDRWMGQGVPSHRPAQYHRDWEEHSARYPRNNEGGPAWRRSPRGHQETWSVTHIPNRNPSESDFDSERGSTNGASAPPTPQESDNAGSHSRYDTGRDGNVPIYRDLELANAAQMQRQGVTEQLHDILWRPGQGVRQRSSSQNPPPAQWDNEQLMSYLEKSGTLTAKVIMQLRTSFNQINGSDFERLSGELLKGIGFKRTEDRLQILKISALLFHNARGFITYSARQFVDVFSESRERWVHGTIKVILEDGTINVLYGGLDEGGGPDHQSVKSILYKQRHFIRPRLGERPRWEIPPCRLDDVIGKGFGRIRLKTEDFTEDSSYDPQLPETLDYGRVRLKSEDVDVQSDEGSREEEKRHAAPPDGFLFRSPTPDGVNRMTIHEAAHNQSEEVRADGEPPPDGEASPPGDAPNPSEPSEVAPPDRRDSESPGGRRRRMLMNSVLQTSKLRQKSNASGHQHQVHVRTDPPAESATGPAPPLTGPVSVPKPDLKEKRPSPAGRQPGAAKKLPPSVPPNRSPPEIPYHIRQGLL